MMAHDGNQFYRGHFVAHSSLVVALVLQKDHHRSPNGFSLSVAVIAREEPLRSINRLQIE